MGVLTTERARQIRQGILMARRNYDNHLGLPYDAQKPHGRLRQRAYGRSWGRKLGKYVPFPPRASSTIFKQKMHGPSLEEKFAALDDGTLFTTFYPNYYNRKTGKE